MFLNKSVVLDASKFTKMTAGASSILEQALVSVAYYGVQDGSVPILSRLEVLKNLLGIKQATNKVANRLGHVKGREKLSDQQKHTFAVLRAEWSAMNEQQVYEAISSWFKSPPEKEVKEKTTQERLKGLHKYLDKNIDTAGLPADVVAKIAELKTLLENKMV